MQMKNVIIRMPNGEVFLVETCDKGEFMKKIKQIEEVLIQTNEIMEDCLSYAKAQRIVCDFLDFIDVVNDYSELDYTIDCDLRSIFEE